MQVSNESAWFRFGIPIFFRLFFAIPPFDLEVFSNPFRDVLVVVVVVISGSGGGRGSGGGSGK